MTASLARYEAMENLTDIETLPEQTFPDLQAVTTNSDNSLIDLLNRPLTPRTPLTPITPKSIYSTSTMSPHTSLREATLSDPWGSWDSLYCSSVASESDSFRSTAISCSAGVSPPGVHRSATTSLRSSSLSKSSSTSSLLDLDKVEKFLRCRTYSVHEVGETEYLYIQDELDLIGELEQYPDLL